MKDYHIHIWDGPNDTPETFLQKTKAAGVDGGAILSYQPESYFKADGTDQRWEALLDQVLSFTAETPGFLPMFWVDPTDKDIAKQIQTAVDRGIKGFKIICNHFYPSDVLKEIRMIAETGLPLNFHTGILYSFHPAAKFNRPIEFECLMELKNLKFSLAHIGWPWTDEYTAIFGEFNWSSCAANAYIDMTPGTPPVYRRDVLRKLFLSGYDSLKTHTLWGTDCTTNDYNTERAKEYMQQDESIFAEIAQENSDYRDLWEHICEKNFNALFNV